MKFSISNEGDWTGWIEFFLGAVEKQALENANRVKMILDLYETMKQKITDLTRSQYALKILDTLFDRPVFQSGDFIARSGVPRNSAMPFLRTLRDEGVLVVLRESSGPRSAIYYYQMMGDQVLVKELQRAGIAGLRR